VELLPQETVALASTVMAQVELLVQVTLQDCPHEPLQVLWLLQNRSQLAEPPQLLWETSQDEPWTQIQLLSTQFSWVPLQPAQSNSRRQDRISARMAMRQDRAAHRVRAAYVDLV
jgi:hypothetical protein